MLGGVGGVRWCEGELVAVRGVRWCEISISCVKEIQEQGKEKLYTVFKLNGSNFVLIKKFFQI